MVTSRLRHAANASVLWVSFPHRGSCTFNDIAAAMYDREDEILNYFVNRSTNASAESLNAKIKDFRAQLRGVIDKKFFIFRLVKIFG